jgi:hypothetical protein
MRLLQAMYRRGCDARPVRGALLLGVVGCVVAVDDLVLVQALRQLTRCHECIDCLATVWAVELAVELAAACKANGRLFRRVLHLAVSK